MQTIAGRSRFEIRGDGLAGLLPDGDEARFVAFAGHADDAVVEVEVLQARIDELGDAQAAGVEQLEDGAVAQAARRVVVHAVEQLLDLQFVHRLGQVALDARQRQELGDIALGCARGRAASGRRS